MVSRFKYIGVWEFRHLKSYAPTPRSSPVCTKCVGARILVFMGFRKKLSLTGLTSIYIAHTHRGIDMSFVGGFRLSGAARCVCVWQPR